MNTPALRKSERGNVIFYILVAVALLAALSFAISESTRGNVNQLNSERAEIHASEIIEYANVVSNAVAQLRLRGCDETEISFENDAVAGYTNGNSPTDNSCHIFHIDGGGVTWNIPQAEMLVSATAPDDSWAIYDSNEIEDVGTTVSDDPGVDIPIFLKNLDLSVCIEINDKLGVDNPSSAPPTDSGLDNSRFIGSFSYADTVGDEDTALAQKTAACYTDGGASLGSVQYVFYKVLIAR